MNPSTIPTHFCSKIGRVDASPDTNGRFEFILSVFFHLHTLDYGYMPGRRCAGFLAPKSGWYQNQVGTKIRVVPKSGWYQNQGGTKVRLVPKSGWYQNQVGTKTRLVPKSVHPKLALSANQSTCVGEFWYFFTYVL